MGEEVGKEKVVHRGRIIAFVLTCLFSVGAIAAGLFSRMQEDHGERNSRPQEIGYEEGSVVVTDEDELQKAVDGMLERAKDGSMALEYKNIATSENGETFKCHLVNSVKNSYDMYMAVYLDDALEDEVLLTKLIPPGHGLESFTASRKLGSGTYEAVLVFTRVGDDHASIKDQVSVVYTLVVQ